MQLKKLEREQRKLLHKPFGKIMRAQDIAHLLMKTRKKVVSVGDICSFGLIGEGVVPHISICDGKSLRRKVRAGITSKIREHYAKRYHIKNPRGTINEDALLIIGLALRDKQGSYIYVDGEEDLLALAAMMKCRKGNAVVYGQPGQGIVYVDINQKIKEKARRIFRKMDIVNV